jgi:hypothetical protein
VISSTLPSALALVSGGTLDFRSSLMLDQGVSDSNVSVDQNGKSIMRTRGIHDVIRAALHVGRETSPKRPASTGERPVGQPDPEPRSLLVVAHTGLSVEVGRASRHWRCADPRRVAGVGISWMEAGKSGLIATKV